MKLFRQNIIAQIALLLAVFFVSLLGLNVGHGVLKKRLDFLQHLQVNEQVKLELSHLLQKDLLAINVRLQEMSNTNSLTELSRHTSLISQLKDNIADVLAVIDKGGGMIESYPVNFGNEEMIRRQLNYVNYNPQRINLEVIEIRAKLTELDEVVEQFEVLVREKVACVETRESLLIAETIRKVSNFYKGVEPFFVRLLENSNRLYYESQKETERIARIYDVANQRFSTIVVSSTTASLLLTLLLGFIVLRSSRRILLERQQYQQQLILSNESLESKVKERTTALEQEIAERKIAELRVSEQAQFLTNTIEALSHPFYVINAETYAIVLANSAALDGCRTNCTTCYALTHDRDLPCDGEEHPCPLQIVRQTGRPVVLEHLHRDAKGRERFVEVHGYPIFDGSGKLSQIIEYSLDITVKKQAELTLLRSRDELEEKVRERTRELEEQIQQRKQAQLSLRNSERHYRRLIENISDIITIIDQNGKISYTSPSTMTVLGFPPEQMIGHDVREFIHRGDRADVEIETLYQSSKAAGKHKNKGVLEYRVANAAGDYRLLESTIDKFVQNDGTEGFILSSRDTTSRHEAEEEARKLQLVIEQTPSSVVVTDTEGRIEYVNPAFEKITGYQADEVIGENPRLLKSGKTPETTFVDMWQRITRGEIWRGEFINKKKNEEFYEESVLIIPIKNRRGDIANFVAVKENITQLKRAQRQAEQANRAKSEFLSRMSHELRTPLNAINGFSLLMLNSKKHALDEKQQNMTRQIHLAGNHLLQLINEILDLAKIESGELSLKLEAIDPREILRECFALIKPLAREKSLQVIDHVAAELPLLWVDATRLKQVLINLMSNAVKYNRSNGLVEVYAEPWGGHFLRFDVCDCGIGIPVEKQKDIFTPFFRSHDTEEKIEGTGIGLSITRQIVEIMGGEIGFESRENEGSRFWFTVPLATTSRHDGNPLSIETESSAETEKSEVKRILYVEDDPGNVAAMTTALAGRKGIQLTVATSAEEALIMVPGQIPDLIILDLNLPDMDGFQLYRHFKANPATEFVPVVAVSADTPAKTLGKVKKLGFNGHLTKPFDPELLQRLVAEILEL